MDGSRPHSVSKPSGKSVSRSEAIVSLGPSRPGTDRGGRCHFSWSGCCEYQFPLGYCALHNSALRPLTDGTSRRSAGGLQDLAAGRTGEGVVHTTLQATQELLRLPWHHWSTSPAHVTGSPPHHSGNIRRPVRPGPDYCLLSPHLISDGLTAVPEQRHPHCLLRRSASAASCSIALSSRMASVSAMRAASAGGVFSRRSAAQAASARTMIGP
jgi:hypothetical protein